MNITKLLLVASSLLILAINAFADNCTTYDDISFALYKDINNPGTEIQNSKVFKFRGYDDQRKKYQVPDMNLAELEIVDIFGRIIRTFGSDGSGEFSINWDLTDNQGKTVPSGIYICRLRSGDETRTRTITVIK
jgi:flagellar hook assembly protein FlgD